MVFINKQFQANFLRGLIILLPIILTIFVSYWVFLFLYRIMDFGVAFLPQTYREFPSIGVSTRFLVVLATAVSTVILLTATGWAIKTVVGKVIGQWFQSIMISLPIVRSIYKGFKQLLNLLFANPTQSFSKVVLVEFPERGTWAYGFITGEAPQKICPPGVTEAFNVFVPGTPNPTSGFLLIVPKDQVRIQNLTIDQGMKIVVSGGILEK